MRTFKVIDAIVQILLVLGGFIVGVISFQHNEDVFLGCYFVVGGGRY